MQIWSKTLELENSKESRDNHIWNCLLPIRQGTTKWYVIRNNYIDINTLENSSMHKSHEKRVETVGYGLAHKHKYMKLDSMIKRWIKWDAFKDHTCPIIVNANSTIF